MSIYQNYIDDLRVYSLVEDETRFVAKQLLELHSEALRRDTVTILELGVDRGQSTKVFLNAIDGKPCSHLVSVDIRDCSDVSNSSMWTFVKNDSADIVGVVNAAPILKTGIDILYIDSLHTDEHVQKEVYGFFPYLKIILSFFLMMWIAIHIWWGRGRIVSGLRLLIGKSWS